MKSENYMNKDMMLFFEYSINELQGAYNELIEIDSSNWKMPNLLKTEIEQKDVDNAILKGQIQGYRMAIISLKLCGRKMIYGMEE